MDNQLFDYSPITERDPISWPGGARIAFYVGLNVEHYQVDRPSTSIFPGTAGLAPDPLNYGWRDYGPRVGIWRLKDQLDQLYEDAADSGRVMSLVLHPFVINQPFRHKYLDQALEHIAQHPGVWLTTSDEIAEHYARTTAGTPA
ncbi:hypothetical protein [Streptomyces sp. NPDC059122]|uniref:hypothetical protein n=1 Tax=unclassified Streptomyces TaxID=2593676 RepID=UPI003686761B